MPERNVDSVVNVNASKPEEVVDNEQNMTVSFITVELEDDDGGIVGVHEQQDHDLVLHRLPFCENISTMNSSKASHGLPSEAFFFYKLVNRSFKLSHIEQVHGSQKIAANHSLVFWKENICSHS